MFLIISCLIISRRILIYNLIGLLPINNDFFLYNYRFLSGDLLRDNNRDFFSDYTYLFSYIDCSKIQVEDENSFVVDLLIVSSLVPMILSISQKKYQLFINLKSDAPTIIQ